ncbi:MAG: ABC-type multidrug transport system component [Ignavibacteria bacterium]|nr:ABC-type multidrug transport system component [Ignavibacteria bacterium]
MAEQTQSDKEFKDIDFRLLKRLIKFLKPYKKFVVYALLLAIFGSALGPLRPYLTKIAIDNYIASSDWNGLLWIIILIFGLLIIHSAAQFFLSYIMQFSGQNVLNDIRIKLHKHILALSNRFHDTNPVGRLVTRVTNDIEALNELFSSGVVMIIADFLLIMWIIGFMLFTNVTLALLTLAVMPVLIMASIAFRSKVRETFRAIRGDVAKMNSFLNEFISGIVTVKIFAQEKYQNEKFDGINTSIRDLWNRTIFYYALFFPIVEFLSTLTLGIILWYAAKNILSTEITVGVIIAFTQYAEMFFRPIRDLTEKYTTLQSSMASAERIFGLLDTNEFLEDLPEARSIDEFKESIEFKNVCFSYDGDKQVLKNISFKINKGETVAIVGATGSGKTSIVNLLCRFYDYQTGEILIDGKDIRTIKQESLRSRIALVMQEVFLFSGSIGFNITLGEESITKEETRLAALALGAAEFIEKLPDAYDSVIEPRGTNLSSGQRQLISFCRAFASNPEILILDEATSNIDSETEKLIEISLGKLLGERTSLVIAHRLSTIKRADKILVLHHGELRETGTHEELLNNDGLYAKLYRLQFN